MWPHGVQGMDTILARDADLGRLGGPDRSGDRAAAQIQQLSTWVMILGTVRFFCETAEYASAFLSMTSGQWPAHEALGRFLQEHALPVLLMMSWPLIVGLILRRTGGHVYLVAAAITFLVLSAGGIAHLVEGLSLRYDATLVVGSFSVSRFGLSNFNAADLIRASMGVLQLTLELAAALYAVNLAIHWRGQRAVQPADRQGARHRLRGRLAIYLSLAFLVVGMRMPFWTAYIEILNRSSYVRDLVLSTAPQAPRSQPGHYVLRPRPRTERETVLANAARLAAMNRVPEAIRVYRQIITEAEESGTPEEENPNKELLARTLNNLAWALATCEDLSLRRPAEAVTLAQRAVKLAPEEGTYWNTLGAAFARVRQWDAADNALRRSMALRDENGDAFDWFLLAIVDAERGDKAQARAWYDKAVAWFHDGHGDDEELYRFQVEAAKTLELPLPPRPESHEARPEPVPEEPARNAPHRRGRPVMDVSRQEPEGG